MEKSQIYLLIKIFNFSFVQLFYMLILRGNDLEILFPRWILPNRNEFKVLNTNMIKKHLGRLRFAWNATFNFCWAIVCCECRDYHWWNSKILQPTLPWTNSPCIILPCWQCPGESIHSAYTGPAIVIRQEIRAEVSKRIFKKILRLKS